MVKWSKLEMVSVILLFFNLSFISLDLCKFKLDYEEEQEFKWHTIYIINVVTDFNLLNLAHDVEIWNLKIFGVELFPMFRSIS